MSDDKIPPRIIDFIAQNIDTIGLLQVLCLIHKHNNRSWNSLQISHELRDNESSVDRHLTKLHALKIVSRTTQSPFAYEYEPNDESLSSVIDGLVSAYSVYPIRVMELIYKKPNEALRNFADAFKIKKDSEDG